MKKNMAFAMFSEGIKGMTGQSINQSINLSINVSISQSINQYLLQCQKLTDHTTEELRK